MPVSVFYGGGRRTTGGDTSEHSGHHGQDQRSFHHLDLPESRGRGHRT